MFYDQGAFDIRCEWGEKGVEALSRESDVVIIVDVFSFSTTVDVALARGAVVYPFRHGDIAAAAEFAIEKNAELVGKRGESRFSFSPKAMMDVPAGTRLVLPSQNGAALSLMTEGKPTLTGCLRNRLAVSAYARQLGRQIAVIPGGERWEDGSLRPAVEDWIAAGAIIAGLPGSRSSEASAAVATFEALRGELEMNLKSASSGTELQERKYEDDAAIAADLDCSECVPRLVEGAYRNAGGGRMRIE